MFNLLESDIKEIIESTKDFNSEFEGKSILITGGLGFLGKYFCEYFKLLNESFKTPCKITVVDNFISSSEKQLPKCKNFKFLNKDIIKYKPKDKFDFILSAAGLADPRAYNSKPLETLDVTIIATRNMLNILGDGKMLFFSSSEMYGDPDKNNVPTKETYRGFVDCIGTRSVYDESKRLGETLCYIYNKLYNSKVKIIRPFNFVGPGMGQDDYRVLPNFLNKLLHDESIKIFGTGNQTRTYCYVSDGISASLRVLVLGEGGNAYNAGVDGPEISVIDLANTLEKVINLPIKKEIVKHPDYYTADEPNRRCPDLTKIKNIGYKPTVLLEDGLKRFYEWAKVNYK